jgi:hypothetical protein
MALLRHGGVRCPEQAYCSARCERELTIVAGAWMASKFEQDLLDVARIREWAQTNLGLKLAVSAKPQS